MLTDSPELRRTTILPIHNDIRAILRIHGFPEHVEFVPYVDGVTSTAITRIYSTMKKLEQDAHSVPRGDIAVNLLRVILQAVDNHPRRLRPARDDIANLLNAKGITNMFVKEVMDAKIAMVWETVGTVKGFIEHRASNKSLWAEVEEVAKTAAKTAARTKGAWVIVENQWGAEVTKHLTHVHTGHHYARNVASLAQNMQEVRGGVRTIPKDFGCAVKKPPKESKLTDDELRKIKGKLDAFGLLVPEDDDDSPKLQEPTGLA
ncbi:uncharacterized protein CDV56_106593 [Aspergillus thermomutatus]|uniref:Uncharacterized protein n=1 Tax=Aspergillus thermomutatus TaxID=41047 RepID=A0A397GW47_ASPTH|nr:uncharacterized protein CDV56_106593 [Aspergillus thermomutatus]RHZ54857.1 hypothetical protein CDV56_106593 [Aspergillus thermomutatus]